VYKFEHKAQAQNDDSFAGKRLRKGQLNCDLWAKVTRNPGAKG